MKKVLLSIFFAAVYTFAGADLCIVPPEIWPILALVYVHVRAVLLHGCDISVHISSLIMRQIYAFIVAQAILLNPKCTILHYFLLAICF